MSNETFRNKLRTAKFFVAALLLVTLTLLVSFGTPVNAACTVRFLNTTNLTAYWGQPVTVGINVTDTTTGNYVPALGSVFKLDLVCSNTTLCGAQTANQTAYGNAIVAATGATGGGFASLTLPALQNPLYTSAAVGSGVSGAPLFPGNYYTVINFVSGGCSSGANVTEMGVNIIGYAPLLSITNIVNGSSPSPGYGLAVNVSFNYNAPSSAVLSQARHNPNITTLNFSVGSNFIRGSEANYTVFTNGSAAAYGAHRRLIVRNMTSDLGSVSDVVRIAPLSTTTVSLNNSWTRDRVYVNVTATTQDGWYVSYANTTINYINVRLNKNDGGPFTSNAFLWKLNGTTKIPMIPAGWGLNHAQAPPFIPLTAGTFTINCYDPESRCYDANRPTGRYSVSGSILGPTGETTGIMASELENAAVQIVAYDMASSNMTDTWTITPYGNAKAINLTLNNSGSMSQFSVKSLSQMQGSTTLSSMRIYDGSGMVYSVNTSRTDEFERSLPLKLGTNYSVEVAGWEENGQPFATHNITYTPVFNGFGGAVIMVWNASLPSSSYTIIKGQVLSQVSGVRNITVYAEPRNCFAGGPFVTACIVNSSLTDASGLFDIRVPRIPGFSEYKLTAIDARRNDSADRAFSGPLIHYPTKDDNNGRYYQAQGALLVAPPINMTYAGTMRLSVGVTPNVFGVMTELSRLRLLATGWVRDNFASRMAMANVFGFMTTAAPITSVTFPMDSPTNGSSAVVNLFFWGMGMTGSPGMDNPPTVLSGNRTAASITWRQFTGVSANTTTQGNLVLRVSTCNGASAFSQQSGACSTPTTLNPMSAGDNTYWSFWWNSKVIIYEAGNFSQPYQYLEGNEESMFLSRGKIPLMPGRYSMDIQSKYDWNKPLSQNRTITFQINPGADTILTVYVFSPGWDIRSPAFPYTMRSTIGNNLTAAVVDLAGSGSLTQTSSLNMTFQAVNINGTAMMKPVNMTWTNITSMGGQPIEMFNWTFVPSQYGISAGKYIGIFKANLTNYSINPFSSTDRSGECASATTSCTAGYYADLYITSQPQQFQFIVSDFDIGTEPSKRTYSPSETITATLYGFNKTDINGLNGTVVTYVYNEAGKLLNSTPTTWSLTDMARYNMSYGIANLSIRAPATVGWYELLSVVNVTGGKGSDTTSADTLINTTTRGWALSDIWVKVSNFGFEDKYDKRSYATSDPVKLGITLTNGTTGAAIPSAAITAFVDQDQTPTFAMTDPKGRAAFQLSKSGGWSYGGHNVRMAVSVFNSSGNNDVVNEEFFSWFDVGGIDVNFYPTKTKYAVADNVTVNVYSTSVSDSSKFSLYVDGNETKVTWTAPSANYWTASLVPQVQWLPGRHFLQLKVGGGSGSASFYSGFETAAINFIIAMNKSEYSVGDTVGAQVRTINATTMLPVSNVLVTGNFYKQSAGSNKLVFTSTNITSPTGVGVLNVTARESGYYVLEVLARGQKETATFRASGMSVLVQGNSTFRAGDTVQFNITSIAQSTVEPVLWGYGEKLSLPSGMTSRASSGIYGDYILNYTLPSDAPAGTYALDVKVTTNTSLSYVIGSSVVGFNTTTFSAVSAYSLQLSSGKSSMEAYRQGETALLTASLRNDTSPASGVNLTFAIGGKTITDTIKGTALTDASGKAVLSTTVPSADDFYYAKTYVTNSPEVAAYAPITVASLNVTLVTINGTTGLPADRFVLGAIPDVIYNVTARTSSGTIVNFSDGATTGSINVLLFNKEGGEISQALDTSLAPTSDGRYSLNTTLPNITGSFSFVGIVRANNTMGFARSMAMLSAANLIMNITTNPTAITANQTTFNVTVNVFNDVGTGQVGNVSVAIFSPTATNRPIYDSRNINTTSDYPGWINVNISANNITYPGIYVIKAEFTGVGGAKISNYTLLRVTSAAYPVTVEVSSITSSSAVITSNVPNATAYLMRESGGRTTTMALPLVPSGSNFYTTATGLSSGTNYFVRLDTLNATRVNATMFRTA